MLTLIRRFLISVGYVTPVTNPFYSSMTLDVLYATIGLSYTAKSVRNTRGSNSSK